MQKILFVIPIVIILIWLLVLTPQLKHNLEDFNFTYEQRGIDQIVSSYGGDLSEPFVIEEITSQQILNSNNNILEIKASVVGKNLDMDEEIFHFEEIFYVDSITRKNTDGEKGYFVLPFNVEKKDYFVHNPLVTVPADFRFENEEKIYGLAVYRFSCDTVGNDLSDAFPQFFPHQIHIDYECDIWVEPITGNIINYKSLWDAYFVEDGVRTYQVEKGGKETTDPTVFFLVRHTQDVIQTTQLYEIIIPTIIAITSTIIIISNMFREKILEKNKEVKDEKLKTIGELSSRLAHDIRNPLAVIKSANSLMKEKGSLSEEDKARADMINDAVTRIAHQIDDVLDFLKKRPIQLTPNSFLEVLASAKKDVSIPTKIDLVVPKNDVVFPFNFEKFRVVIINLLLNAVQAIEKSGKIVVDAIEKDDKIIITIQDSGSGVADVDINKIFDPLFTTKQEGTGLGLASCMTIIEQHNGTISVSTNPTTFTIILPKTKI